MSSSGSSANATIHFQLDKQGASNATGTITDIVTQCPTGLTCTPSAAVTTTDTDLTQTFHPTITVRNNSFCSLSTIQNQAKFVDAQGTTVVSTTASVSVTGTCAAPGADLSITKTGPASVATNARFSWQLTVRDNGTLDATSVVVTDHLPTGISLVSTTASQGTCSGSATVTCSLGTLANGKSATVTLAVKAGSNDTVTNTASVTAKESDSNQSNNVASSTVTVGSGGTKGCRLKVAAPGFYVGIQTTIAVTATFNGAPLTGTKITLAGTSGIKGQSKSTDTKGKVSFVVHAGRPGAAVTPPIAPGSPFSRRRSPSAHEPR